MKKQLLLICFLLVNSLVFGQSLNQPSQFNSVCDDNNDGFALFYMQEISFEIIGNNQPILVVTHHLTQSDAVTGSNPLPNNYTNVSNPQLIFARVVDTQTSQVQIIAYNLTVNPTPLSNAFTFQGCDTDNVNDGITFFPELSFFDNNFNQNGQHTISYYFNSFDAQNATNALPSNVPFQNTTPQMQLLFVRVVNPITGCFSIAQLFLAVQNCNPPICTAPTTLNVSNVTQYSAQLSWASTSNSIYNVYVTLAGLPAPSANTVSTGTTSSNIFTATGLTCATAYQFYVKKVCPNSISSEWVGPYNFNTFTCTQIGGQPQDMYQCGTGVTACFNLTQNDANILGTLNPAQYQITYHNLFTDAETGNNPIQTATQYCTTFAEQIFTRLLNLQDNTNVVASFGIYLVDAPPAPTQNLTVCGNETTGPICVDLASLIPNLSSGGAFNVTFYETQANASSGTNAIQNPGCYPLLTMLPTPTPVYYRIENTSSDCSSVGIVNVFVVQCNPTCLPPANITASVSANTAEFIWTQTNSSMYEVFLGLAGTPGPIQSTVPTGSTIGTTYSFTGLQCSSVYQFYVRSVCNANETSLWSAPFTITTFECNSPGQPASLTQCSDNGSACFNLNDNNNLILGTLNPLEYSITYYTSQSDASNGANPINTAQPFCTSLSPTLMFARLLNLTTNQAQIFAFQLIIQTVSQDVTQLPNMIQCDDNNDGLVTFDLTTVQTQINVLGSLTFFNNYQDAVSGTNPITNPTAYNLTVVGNSMSIVVRVDLQGCDALYNLVLVATANCNVSSTCINANSLCNALGAPFVNTQNLSINEPGANYGCLNTHPNPTWFYLPVSSPGTISLKVEQNRNVDFNSDFLDVDYIVYGPFTSPVAPCNGSLTTNNIVSCSYSANSIEYPIINNALTGQYYLIMTTNFSNQAGFIRITETGNSQGGINCSGIRLNAFLDSNSNGTKDVGESNFPLGQFQIEKNNDGNVHNITAPSGVYNLYDETASNSYDLGYTIDPAYSAAYVLTTVSYSNISPVIGGGLQVYNFPITVVQSYQDIAVSIIPLDQPRAGFIYSNKIVYGNFGNQTIVAGTVTFTKDAALTIISNTQSGIISSSNGFSYNFTNLLPFEVRTITVTMQVPPIPVVNLGQLLINNATIVPLVGDVVPENNSSTLSEIVTGSYDPNDKMESHGDKIVTSNFATTDYLYYTIRFENTGTASAINVRITDLLDSKLDETSVKMVSASHEYILDRLDSSLTWKFNNILLPQSVENTKIGKGYVMFKVKPKAGYTTGDIIPNTAGIYFDFNPVIVTNTFLTEFVTTLAVNEFENPDFIFYPNPVQDMLYVTLKNNNDSIELIEVYDALGKSMLHKTTTTPLNTDSIDLTHLSSGLYFIEVTTSNQSKVIKKVMRK
jgi:uncharacterized repeat protein (TIGR01451 family)